MLIDGKPLKGRVIFAHGAGAPMDSDFMEAVTAKLVDIGLEVIRFEFPYMQKRREDGKKRPPDRAPKLLDSFKAVISQFKDDVPLFLAGKSMGGRMASMLVESEGIDAGFVFGYPFHPPGKPDTLRVEHLLTLQAPLHIFQGTRDALGNFEEVRGYNLSENVEMHWMEDGNHDLKPRKSSGFSQEDHLNRAVQAIGEWIS
ncbi:MAG: alpha/beta family hydrolase [Neptuniibacter sp.]